MGRSTSCTCARQSAERRARTFFSKSQKGLLASQFAAGYEIYERPENAQVVLRKPPVTRILPVESAYVLAEYRRAAQTDALIVDIEGDSMIVYFAKPNHEIAQVLFGDSWNSPYAAARMEQWRVRHGRYEKLLRFTLVSELPRLFEANRWCFRGSIDGWINLGPFAPLEQLVGPLAAHLGKESFFELAMTFR